MKTKIWLLVAAGLILIGCILFGGVMTVLHWDFKKLSTGKFETNEHAVTSAYRSICVETETADITFLPAEGSETKVVCFESDRMRHEVAVEEDILVIRLNDTRNSFEKIGIGFNFVTPKITVYLPQSEYKDLSVTSTTGDVEVPADVSFQRMDIALSTGDAMVRASVSDAMNLRATTGDLCVEGVSSGSMVLSVTTGDIRLTDVKCAGDLSARVSTGDVKATGLRCRNFTSEGTTGKLELKDVIASESLSGKRSTGDIVLDACDASDLVLRTGTGSVKGSLLSGKTFVTKTSTGSVKVPSDVPGGRCEISTGTGSIKITVKSVSD